MTTNELRAKFEAWATSKGSNLVRTFDGDDYLDSWTSHAWVAWQAAHASRDAEVEALRKDARRWRHARKLLTIEDIEEAQRDFVSYGRMVSEEGCAYADQAIDDATQAE